LITRFKILWAAVKNLFTGRGVYLSRDILVHADAGGISAERWVKTHEGGWDHQFVTFDGKVAKGYVNGVEVVK
jgi:hypothetical protein